MIKVAGIVVKRESQKFTATIQYSGGGSFNTGSSDSAEDSLERALKLIKFTPEMEIMNVILVQSTIEKTESPNRKEEFRYQAIFKLADNKTQSASSED